MVTKERWDYERELFFCTMEKEIERAQDDVKNAMRVIATSVWEYIERYCSPYSFPWYEADKFIPYKKQPYVCMMEDGSLDICVYRNGQWYKKDTRDIVKPSKWMSVNICK